MSFKFRTEDAVIAEFDTFEEAATYSERYADGGEGVAAVLPSGGMMNSKAFMFYARQRTAAIARVAARKADEEYAAQSTPSNEAIAFAHKRSYSMTDGPTTYAQHVKACTPCAAWKAAKAEIAAEKKARRALDAATDRGDLDSDAAQRAIVADLEEMYL